MQDTQAAIDNLAGQFPGSDTAAFVRAVEYVRASGVLGEARLRSLFDYLVKMTFAGESPKELAIAMDVFGKTSNFDVTQDALVRVYIHKLRKLLDNFRTSGGTTSADLLYLPRGEYRLRLLKGEPPTFTPRQPFIGRRIQIALLGSLVLAAIAVAAALLWTPKTDVERVRASPVWAGILSDDRPIMIVVGDYYLVGDYDDSMEVKRLVREYSVNSKDDLDRFVEEHPEFASRYKDVGVRYLPISAAMALRNVMAVLAPQNRRITVTKMSDLEPNNLKSADIVYIGYLSGMGMFQDLVFSGSRFEVGESYDVVIDKQTHHNYVSEVGSQVLSPAPPTGKEQSYRDYGVFEKLRGPDGNTILVIAGTRDEGVSQTGEAFTSAQTLNDVARQTNGFKSFEALLEVRAVDGTNLSGQIIAQSSRDKTSAK